MTKATQRLFFALWPSQELREALAQALGSLRASAEGRLIAPENYHLTLAFLDSVPGSSIPDVIAAGHAVRFAPFALTLDCYGVFAQPQVLWYGSSAVPEALAALVANLRRNLEGLVKLRPERNFCPHVSVVRKMSVLPELPAAPKLVWQASDFALVHSETGPGHAIYTVLEWFSVESA